jgi:hypothetical protein
MKLILTSIMIFLMLDCQLFMEFRVCYHTWYTYSMLLHFTPRIGALYATHSARHLIYMILKVIDPSKTACIFLAKKIRTIFWSKRIWKAQTINLISVIRVVGSFGLQWISTTRTTTTNNSLYCQVTLG